MKKMAMMMMMMTMSLCILAVRDFPGATPGSLTEMESPRSWSNAASTSQSWPGCACRTCIYAGWPCAGGSSASETCAAPPPPSQSSSAQRSWHTDLSSACTAGCISERKREQRNKSAFITLFQTKAHHRKSHFKCNFGAQSPSYENLFSE